MKNTKKKNKKIPPADIILNVLNENDKDFIIDIERKLNIRKPDIVSKATDNIEYKLVNSLKTEVSSIEIGEMVMNGLKNIDEVAYVRFASVYRQFKDINTFMDELAKLLSEK